jgi:hypothetical protein
VTDLVEESATEFFGLDVKTEHGGATAEALSAARPRQSARQAQPILTFSVIPGGLCHRQEDKAIAADADADMAALRRIRHANGQRQLEISRISLPH